jgi:endonuclease/exonuclease/phosphatase family metal-dependent hydrolase
VTSIDPTTDEIAMTVSRRDFHALAGAAGLAALAWPAFANESANSSLHVIAYNVYECTGWPKDRALGKKATALGQMPDRFAAELALYEPDIINFSESPKEDVGEAIAKKLNMHLVRFPSGGKWPGTLLSKYEIVSVENTPLGGERPQDLFTRHWGRGTVKTPGEDIIVHSAHLHPSDQPTRLKEIALMIRSMKPDLEAGRSMLLMGDLNHTPNVEEYQLWLDAGWVDTFTKVGQGDGFTIKADTPDRRIDYIFAAGPLARRIQESRPLNEGAFRLNPEDAVGFCLSDHLPQLAVFGGE